MDGHQAVRGNRRGKILRIATRGSRLALAQTAIVEKKLHGIGYETERVIIKTRGDLDRTSPIESIGGNGLFVREIERALLDDEADIAVHSAKDLPCELSEGLTIAGVPDAAAVNDCIVYRRGEASEAPKRIGAGSPRRSAQLRVIFPEAEILTIRGNVDTRLKKLSDGEYDAIALAEAGLLRLGIDESGYDIRRITIEEAVPSPCQGLIAAECRDDDEELIFALRELSDEAALRRFEVERYMLGLIGASCSEPLGIYADIVGDELTLRVFYKGKNLSETGSFFDYKEMCGRLAGE